MSDARDISPGDSLDTPDGYDDIDDEEFLAAWEAAERHAAQVLRAGLAQVETVAPEGLEITVAADRLRRAHAEGDHAAWWMLRAAGIQDPADVSDAELLVASVAATISMVEEPGLTADDAAAVMTLEFADWVGAILGLVRAGPGAAADPASLVDYAEDAEEIDAAPLERDERVLIEHGFLLVLPGWEAAGAVSRYRGPDDYELTRVGAWVLPRAAQHAWGHVEA